MNDPRVQVDAVEHTGRAKTLDDPLEDQASGYLCTSAFVVRPFNRNIARALLKEPKIYFFDNGLVQGDEGARFENACATALLAHARFLRDAEGRSVSLHHVCDKDGREIDFAVCEVDEPLHFVECKLADPAVPPYLRRLAERFPGANCLTPVRHLRQPARRGRVSVERAADWLASLAA